MALQSKLLLLNNGEDIDLELYALDDLEYLTPEMMPQIKEFSSMDIILESTDESYFEMPELDDFYIPGRIQSDNEVTFRYPANINFTLFKMGDSENVQTVPLVPGLYTIRSTINGSQFFSYFYIVPKDLSIPEWQFMKDEVEKTVNGLSVDYYRRRNSSNVKATDNEDNSVSLSKIRYFLSKETELRFVIEKLKKESRYRIGKTYRWEKLGGKNLTDSVTIRKMGERPDKKGMIYSAKRYLDYDVPENRWARHILVRLVSFSKNSLISLKNMRGTLMEDRREESRYDSSRNESNIYFQEKRLQSRLNSLDNDIHRLTQVSSYIHNVLGEAFLEEQSQRVGNQVPKALALNPNYNFLYKLFIAVSKKQSEISFDRAYEYYWKRTDELYEIWTYIRSIEALIQLGYEPESGWFFSVNPFEEILPKLVSGEAVMFHDAQGNQLRLVFNEKIPQAGQSNFEKPLRTDSNRNKPDIRLDMFTNNRQYVGSILMDAKYKRLYNVLRSSHGEKGVMEQFREYRKVPYASKSFWHINELFRGQVLPVQAVIVLYPQNDGTNIQQRTIEQNILMTELNPHSGQSEFVNILREQIDQRYSLFGSMSGAMLNFDS
ncbi:nuclease domain-containing protein [Weissella cibaria]|uniref:nuclease domain-containing protein n=1 Tax=Weissella cibaria TaxID=137591 RepID=UPI001680EFAE|nr:nuclease domain-containing protein [Weissella cibaria]MBD1502801.1 hypothetical protein [Weissella cibaria]